MIKRRLIDGKIVAKRRYYDVLYIIMLIFGGLIFTSAGIGLGVSYLLKRLKGDPDLPLLAEIVVVILFTGAGLLLLGWGIKELIRADRLRRTRRYGSETYADIIDHGDIYLNSHNGGKRSRRFRFVLGFTDEYGIQRFFKTGFYYDINEFRYLYSKESVKVKKYKNCLFIDEDFPIEIYTVDSDFGLDIKITVKSERLRGIRKATAISSVLGVIAFAINLAAGSVTGKTFFIFFAVFILIGSTLPWGIVYVKHIITYEPQDDEEDNGVGDVTESEETKEEDSTDGDSRSDTL